ncbi:VPS35 endosomal protein sorting factor-like isoform X2 [Bactrocera neohumeralis]|uniref:VPS35 endosomal protein sorting factor-like isoform X2 n=1 Tax=Bactrocera tryoni TaxID=59916 RepID=UPI001A97413A|nr:VPS35 endosomal protein sorting factor-like isoform X2 [Bactrocera tryoni]XP_050317604.1 VPS35 endosomal protein sorting factor-like isoform X2 [Bactrocera neohumeralis]
MATDWECIPHFYEVHKNPLQGLITYEHPLKIHGVTVIESKGTKRCLKDIRSSFSSDNSSRASSSISLSAEPLTLSFDGTDPLSLFARQEQENMDPLTQMEKNRKSLDEDNISWGAKRLGILNRYTTSEKLSISTSFLSAANSGGEGIKSQTVVADKVKFRLEQLDDFDDASMSHMIDLTQQEYIQRIEQLNQELIASWNDDQRVKSLKIVIQCSKMLADTSVLSFYPSQFVLITDILDMFGKLVHERLNIKASDGDNRKSSGAEPLYENARETCQNWFFKIASIRELLPRLYLEMAILKCYEFISPKEFDKNLLRITKMIRGIGDPLVQTYARCYLVRISLNVTSNKESIKENFKDFLKIYNTIFSGAVRSELNRQRVSIETYLSLYSPALDFMLLALVHKNSIYTVEIMNECKGTKNNGLLFISMLNVFQPKFIAANALEFVKLLGSSNTEGISKGNLFRALGISVSDYPPLPEQRLQFLNGSFNTIDTFTDPIEYINCIETWAQFIAKNFAITVINDLLGTITLRVNASRTYERFYTQLQNILDKILQHFENTELLLIQENFLPYLDLFKKDSNRIVVCKNILIRFHQKSEDIISDEIVINAIMFIGKILSDSVTAQSVEDERRQISHLISSFIRKVTYPKDFERQLSFYVDAREAFTDLDAVYITLVNSVNKLAVGIRHVIKGNYTQKTGAFVKACIAFCFISIPSITAIQNQMDLYLLTGQVALLNQCLGQADACFEAALQLVSNLPRSVETEGISRNLETYLVSYLCNMLATLVVVPDSPDQGVLYLLRLLLSVVTKFPFDAQSSGLVIVYLQALDMLYIQSLEEFPYHIPGVVSNDELYGHDQKYLTEVNNICVQVIDDILVQLKILGSKRQLRTQATLALDLFLRIIRYANLSREKTFQLAVNLWILAAKAESHIDVKLISHTIQNVECIYEQMKNTNTQNARSLARLLHRIQTK